MKRAARAEKMKAAHPEGVKVGRSVSLASPRQSHVVVPQTAQQKLVLLQQLEPSIVKKLPKFFGCTLAQAAEFAIGTQIPTVITDCVNFLKTNGIREEGIFRVPGNNEAIQTLKNGYEHSKDDNKSGAPAGTLALKSSKVAGPHEIGGLLKLYLRSLPEPIFPFATYKPLLALTDNMRSIIDPPAGKLLEQVSELRTLLMKMPQQNLDTVRFLLVFLSSVSALSSVNFMEVKNLAIVFAPTMLRPASDADSGEDIAIMTDLLSEMPRTINAMEVMIRLGKHLFPNTPPPRTDASKPPAPDISRQISDSRSSVTIGAPPPLPPGGRPTTKSVVSGGVARNLEF